MNYPLKPTTTPGAVACGVIFMLLWTIGSLMFMVTAFAASATSGAPLVGAFFGLLFLAIGVFGLWKAYSARMVISKLGVPELSVSAPVGRLGETLGLSYVHTLKSNLMIDRIQLSVIFRESATYSQGSSSTTVTHDHCYWRESIPAGQVRAAEQIQQTFTLDLPPDAMHTFITANNRLLWFVQVEIDADRLPKFRNYYEIVVLPQGVPSPNPTVAGRMRRPVSSRAGGNPDQ